MLFTSTEFLVFFVLVASAYFWLSHRHRWLLLLLGSYYFYMCWRVDYVAIIAFSTLVDYLCGLRMAALPTRTARKPYLFLSLSSNLSLLFFFKYYGFFCSTLTDAFGGLGLVSSLPEFSGLLLPVGISFYTFQTLTYSIDVYRGRRGAERHLGIFALYVSFFPQLVAGPIERSERLLPQLREEKRFDRDRACSGLRLMLWGFFKKLVIADNLAVVVDRVYGDPAGSAGLASIVGTVCFAFQIFCDFSGYSDIAIGAARVLGIDLTRNFRRPYFARSIGEFWRRWHISLSTWFRDYVYIPLGGNRVGTARLCANLAIVFALSGLWHGANWTFVVWGMLHGLCLILSIGLGAPWRRLKRRSLLRKAPSAVALGEIAATFAVVCLAWVFFRASTVEEAWFVVTHLYADVGSVVDPSYVGAILSKQVLGLSQLELALTVCAVVLMEVVHWLQETDRFDRLLAATPGWARVCAYAAGLAAIFVLGRFGGTEFIYFQF